MATAELNGEQHSAFGNTPEEAKKSLVDKLTRYANQAPAPPEEEVDILTDQTGDLWALQTAKEAVAKITEGLSADQIKALKEAL